MSSDLTSNDEYRRVNHANWEARVPLHVGPDDELDAGGPLSFGQLGPRLDGQQHAEMADRHIVSVHGVGGPVADGDGQVEARMSDHLIASPGDQLRLDPNQERTVRPMRLPLHWQRSAAGTSPRTISTCWPQPE